MIDRWSFPIVFFALGRRVGDFSWGSHGADTAIRGERDEAGVLTLVCLRWWIDLCFLSCLTFSPLLAACFATDPTLHYTSVLSHDHSPTRSQHDQHYPRRSQRPRIQARLQWQETPHLKGVDEPGSLGRRRRTKRNLTEHPQGTVTPTKQCHCSRATTQIATHRDCQHPLCRQGRISRL